MRRLEQVYSAMESTLRRLKASALNDRQAKNQQRLAEMYKTQSDEYSRGKNRYEVLCKDKNAVAGEQAKSMQKSSFTSDNDIPIMQVYDQADFIEKRHENIKKVHEDAKIINGLATDIQGKIYEQDDKLDQLNKKNYENVQQVQKANQELVVARTISSKRNKNMACWVLLIIALAAILGFTGYLLFSSKSS